MPQQSARFAILSEKRLRAILSINENPSGDLILDLRAKQRNRAANTLINSSSDYGDHGVGIKEYRYSIHRSLSSAANTIKLTLKDYNDKITTAVQYTVAIKETNSFAFLFARRCSTMGDPGYDIKNTKGTTINLGTLTPSFTLVFGIFAGPRDKKFTFKGNDFNIQQIGFSHFSIVILWSFLTIGNHESGSLMHASSPNGVANRGLNEYECVEIFNDMRTRLRDEFINTLTSSPEITPEFETVLITSTYFKKSDEKKFLKHLKSLIQKGLL